MVIKFTDKFYSKKLVGTEKNLPANIALKLIKTGEAVEVKQKKKPIKKVK